MVAFSLTSQLVFFLVYAFMFLFSSCGMEYRPVNTEAYLDFFQTIPEENSILELSGDWWFVPEVFLDPVRLEGWSLEDGLSFLPHNSQKVRQPRVVRGHFWGSYLTIIRLPAVWQGQELALVNRDINTAARFFVNDRELYSVGQPDTSASQSQPANLHRWESFTPDREYIAVLIHVSNHEVQVGGLLQPPYIALQDWVEESFRQRLILSSVVMGGLGLLLLYQLVFFVLRRKDKATIYYVIMLSGIVLRLLLDEQFLYHWFPAGFLWWLRLEYLTFFILVLAFALYFKALFPSDVPGSIVKVSLAVGGISAALSLVLPLPIISRFLLPLYQYYALVFIFASFLVILRILKCKRVDSFLFLAGALVLLITTTHDIIYFLRIINTTRLAGFGLMIFALIQASVMARRYVRVLSQNEDLNENLEALVQKRTNALNQAVHALEETSLTDPLTGLRNRRFVYETVYEEAVALTRRWAYTRRYWGVIVLDIDHFKSFNDRFGHEAGDSVLWYFARVLKAVLRDDDQVIRWGGEEFLIILKDLDPDQLSHLASRIVESVYALPFPLRRVENQDDAADTEEDCRLMLPGEPSARVSTSLGCCLFPFVPNHPERVVFAEAIKLADIGLYRAKKEGRNRWSLVQAGPEICHEEETDSREGIAGDWETRRVLVFRGKEESI